MQRGGTSGLTVSLNMAGVFLRGISNSGTARSNALNISKAYCQRAFETRWVILHLAQHRLLPSPGFLPEEALVLWFPMPALRLLFPLRALSRPLCLLSRPEQMHSPVSGLGPSLPW